MVNQKTAVINAILSTLAARGVEYELGGETPVSSVLTKEDLNVIKSSLCEGFHAGLITLKPEAQVKYVGNEAEMKKYVNGLVNNWIRKNPEFNNGQDYEAKNPGSRAGSGDESIKNMKLMLKVVTDPQAIADINQAIAERLAEIKPEAAVSINVDAIPEHLRHLVK